ncbi:hypothetical protein ACWF5S_26915 [Peribacillus butanolivorans]
MSLIGVITIKILVSAFVIMFGYVTAQGLTQANWEYGYPKENPNDAKSRRIKNLVYFIGVWFISAFVTFALVYLIIVY